MIRLILFIAVIYGIFWCYNNIEFSSLKNSFVQNVKNEKTIKTVKETRAILKEDSEKVLENY